MDNCSVWLFLSCSLTAKITGLATNPATSYTYLSLRSAAILSLGFICLLSVRLSDDLWIHGSRGSAWKCCVCRAEFSCAWDSYLCASRMKY